MRRGSQGDLGFRLGTGAFAVLVLTIVGAIAVVLISESWLSIQKFAPDLGYAPLPAEVVKLELAALATIKVS